jgi:hypothetical protein
MSKVKKAIETTISEVKKYATQPYGARLYSWESVIELLQRLQTDTGAEDNTPQHFVLNDKQIESLATYISDRVEDSIEGMDQSDIIDSDSIEMSIYRGSANLESFDVNKNSIVAVATNDIQTAIEEWFAPHR